MVVDISSDALVDLGSAEHLGGCRDAHIIKKPLGDDWLDVARSHGRYAGSGLDVTWQR